MTGQHPTTPIEKLRNLGPRSARWLMQAGIETEADLRCLGAAGAYQRVRLLSPDGVSLNLLYALQAALMDIHWMQLPAEIKADLRRQIETDGQDTSSSPTLN